ncbi:MAG: hypothetical protein MMC33_006792 [Icmadophila ericetorum]|nr:hypothetical protein [Icmadophila ericetorum]
MHTTSVATVLWLFAFFYRYFRLFINLLAYWTSRAIVPSKNCFLSSSDVTVIIAALCEGDLFELERTIRSILVTVPHELILVTIDKNIAAAESLLFKTISNDKAVKVRVASILKPCKRHQLNHVLPMVETKICVLADDDVMWPPNLLAWLLAPMENPSCGGVGTSQRVQRMLNPSFIQRIWGFLGALYIERRNFDCAACNWIDGGLPCISGRTAAYRAEILQNQDFLDGFINERWGQKPLKAADDNYITRWLVNHGWEIAFQFHPEVEVVTTLEENRKFLLQCLRWSRSNWRSNLTSLFVERNVWQRQPWSTYAVFLTTLTHWALLSDICLIYFCPSEWRISAYTMMALSKFVKFLAFYKKNPRDIFLIPVSILFGYFHSGLKLYSGLTMDNTGWGSRAVADMEEMPG